MRKPYKKNLILHSNPNNCPTGPKNAQNDSKSKKNTKSEIQKSYKMKVIDYKNIVKLVLK